MALLTGCTFDKDEYIDFSKYMTDSKAAFRPTAIKSTDVSVNLPEDTMLPGGTSVDDFLASGDVDTKATGVTLTAMVQNLLKYGNKSKVIEISGIYESKDQYGNPITVSGKLIIPEKGEIKRVILASHYTIGTNGEAPSNCFPLEGMLVKLGYAVIMPDYIGYGVTEASIHPYLMMDLTSRNVVDMYLSVLPYLKAINRMPENDDIYLMGYSQGGGTTMSVQYLIEKEYGPNSEHPIEIRRNFAGGGIYDIKYTFESFIENNYASYPCGIPFVLVGQAVGNDLGIDILEKLLQPRIYDKIGDWFVTKKTTTLQMNEYIGTHVADQILTSYAMDRTNGEISTLYKCMVKNSVTSYAWSPKAPVYMFHSIDDDTVPYGNAIRAKERWSNSNIQYNFGHYGNHQMGCLRFIFTVVSLLKEEEE